LATLLGVLSARGETGRLVRLAVLIPVLVAVSFTWALSVGGQAVTQRLGTLTAESAGAVYYKSRGVFLEETATVLLPRYPFGAGLGRWGMMHYYFGAKGDPRNTAIWAEIQLTGWLLDGGVPLIATYALAILTALGVAYRIAVTRLPDPLPVWAALILAYDVGAVALTFTYPLFIGQGGLEFWLLNAGLFSAAVGSRR
jgi:hypothetical protein